MSEPVSAGVELGCDRELEAAVRAVWRGFDEAGIVPLRAHGHGQHRPHLTAALAEWLEPAAVRDALADLVWRPIPVELRYVGGFPGVVWLGPVVTSALLAAHRTIHAALAAAGIASHPYYRPDRWIPHCTLALDVPEDRLGDATRLAYAALPIAGTLTDLRLVRHTTTGAEYLPLRAHPGS